MRIVNKYIAFKTWAPNSVCLEYFFKTLFSSSSACLCRLCNLVEHEIYHRVKSKSAMDLALGEKIIVLVDMDCFYVQVEQNEAPEFLNKPCTVVQYNPWKGGGIIAVNYEARAFGVKRGLRGDDAKRLCPEVHNFCVPEVRGKADLTKYREAGAKVLDVLCEFSDCVERASIDEAFLDMTSVVNEKMKCLTTVSSDKLPNTFIVGWDSDSKDADVPGWLESIYEDNHTLLDQKLAVAAVIVEEMRATVYAKTKYKCSAGISHNKMLAKLACGLHKPNKQTILPHSSVPILYKTLPVRKIRNLGGKLGEEVKEKLGVEMMGDLIKFTKSQLSDKFGEKTGAWLYIVARGIEHDSVISRQLPKSIGCGKNFRGKEALDTREKVLYWVRELASELEERVKKDQSSNRRVAKTLTVTMRTSSGRDYRNSVMITRACPIQCVSGERFANDAVHLIQKFNTAPASSPLWQPPVINLALTASKFEDRVDLSSCNISTYFASNKTSPAKSKGNDHCEFDQGSNESTSCHSGSTFSHTEPFVNSSRLDISKSGSNDKNSGISEESPKKSISSYFEAVKSQKHSYIDPDLENLNAKSCSVSAPLVKFAENDDSNSYLDVSGMEMIPETPEFGSVEEKSHGPGPGAQSKGFFARKLKEKSIETLETVLKEKNVSSNDIPEEFYESKVTNNASKSVPHDNTESDSSGCVDHLTKACDDTESLNDQFLNANQSTSHSAFVSGNLETGMPEENPSNLQELSDDVTFLCSKCNCRVPVWEEQEHEDYHVALSMQNEPENKFSRPVSSSSSHEKSKPRVKTVSKKRSLSKLSAANKKTKLQTNTLDAFIKGT